jgi:hypothetical protein
VHHRAHDRSEVARDPVRVQIPKQQHDLKEHHAGDPHSGRSTEPRQQRLSDHRLDHEQQRRVQSDDQRRHQFSDGRSARSITSGSRVNSDLELAARTIPTTQ